MKRSHIVHFHFQPSFFARLLAGFLCSVVLSACTKTQSYVSAVVEQTQATPLPTPSAVPQTLHIPKLGVNAPITAVGLDEQKRMDVPKKEGEVGWYQYGPLPGDHGSAVIDGHLDSPSGPSVFYTLHTLQAGDTLSISFTDGTARQFVVSDVKQYSDAAFPIEKVFLQEDEKRLNLITCSGSFDRSTKNYSNRLVVFTKLQEE